MKQEPEELIASAMQHGKVFAERFELGEKIAEGGMSSVFKARDILLDRQIALKLLDKERAKSGNFLQRFQDEARAGSRLSHPNIVQILNFGVSDGQPFIAMELLDGRTLQEVFASDGPFDRDRLKAVFSEVLSALIYAHEQNIIHRDLKPANIMLTREGTEEPLPKVLDFGIAKIIDLDNQDDSRLTLGFSGSPLYMSPEQCASKKADQRSDVYSLACVMYEAIAKTTPFSGETPFEVMYEHMNSTLPKFQELSSSLKIPRRLVELIFQALNKNPADRPQSMIEFRERFLAAIDSKEILGAKSKSPKVLYLAPIVGCLLALGLFAFLFILNSRTTNTVTKSLSDAYLAKTQKVRRIGGFHEIDSDAHIRSLLDQGKNDEAFSTAKGYLRKASNADEKTKAHAYLCFFEIYARMKNVEQADSYLLKILDLIKSPMAEMRLTSISRRVDLYKKVRNFEKALKIRQEGVQALEKAMGGECYFKLGTSYLEEGLLLKEMGREDQAAKSFKKALHQFDGTKARQTREAVDASLELFDYYVRLGETKLALEEVRKTRDELLISFHHLSADTINQFARQSAASTFDAVNKDLSRGRHHSALVSMNYLAENLENRGFYSDAAQVYEAALLENGDMEPSEKRAAKERSRSGLERTQAKGKSGIKDIYKL